MSAGVLGERSLATEVRELVADALELYSDDEDARLMLTALVRRLDEPLRVAVAGMVKAGKSTLVNALIGEEIAPTDAGECTRVVTWYRYGTAPAVTLYPVSGRPQSLPVRRVDGRLVLDLRGADPNDVDRLVVHWPAVSLRGIILIDTPGTSSLSPGVSERSVAALTRTDVPAEADALVYLMRHLRSADTQFLESFRTAVGAGGGANSIAVLSRADEIGGGRIGALVSARDLADRIRKDRVLGDLAVGIVPVAGLLAQSARTLSQAEYDAFVALAAMTRDETERLLASADRFRAATCPVDSNVREALLDRFGVFGIRLALVLIRGGVRTPTELAHELADRAGLGELVRLVGSQFSVRAEDLKARAAVTAVERLLRRRPRLDGARLERSLEQVRAGAHEFEELVLLARARTVGLDLPPDARDEAIRILGGHGTPAHVRVGLRAGAPSSEVRAEALNSLHRWRQRGASPFSSRAVAEVCALVARSCEGVLAECAGPADDWLALSRAKPGAHPSGGADEESGAGEDHLTDDEAQVQPGT